MYESLKVDAIRSRHTAAITGQCGEREFREAAWADVEALLNELDALDSLLEEAEKSSEQALTDAANAEEALAIAQDERRRAEARNEQLREELAAAMAAGGSAA